MAEKQLELFCKKVNPETGWFHVLNHMIKYDLAKIGPTAFTVYCVVKSHIHHTQGTAFPSIETIAAKAGMAQSKVKEAHKKASSNVDKLTAELKAMTKEKVANTAKKNPLKKIAKNSPEKRPTRARRALPLCAAGGGSSE